MAAALKQFCADDMKKYCPNAQPGADTFMCIRQNRDNFSADCQAALQKLRGGRRGGGGGGP
jgi:hypothetical protein